MKNIVIPVGHNCDVALILRKSGRRKFAYPFDWTVNNYDYVFKVLSSGIYEILTDYIVGEKEYKTWYGEGSGTKIDVRTIYDSNYQVFLVHDYHHKTTIEEIKEKYIKRYDRLITHISEAESITVVGNTVSKRVSNKLETLYLERVGVSIKDTFNTNYSLEDIIEQIRNINPNAKVKQEIISIK